MTPQPHEAAKGTLRRHLRSNVVNYLALILALSGTAHALKGTNTVNSLDIVNDEVRNVDIAGDAVKSVKIGIDEVATVDLAAAAVDGSKAADGTLTGADVANDSLTGSDVADVGGPDVAEGTLSEVPSAKVAGRGRAAYTSASCTGVTSTTYVVCATMNMTLPANGRLFVLGSGTGFSDPNSSGAGTCALYTSATGGFDAIEVYETHGDIARYSGGEFQMSVVTDPIGPGDITIQIHCNRTAGNIFYSHLFISAVQLSAS